MYVKRAVPVFAFVVGATGAVAMNGASAQSAGAVGADTNVQLYGHLDLSLDYATKGITAGRRQSDGTTAVGKLGWQPDVSSNLSYLGVRGDRTIAEGLKGLFQIETQVDVSATPGNSRSNSSSDDNVKGAWASRNSYLGIGGGFGAAKLGKTDAPYKLSTARMDPFSATVGDYNSIMGNTGGDNRAEFDTRLPHAAWYESPKFNGLSFSALFAPGQNRSSDNSIQAAGEPNCTGGNNPDPIAGCNDGAFGNAASIAGVWELGPLYAIGAYEIHKHVNRTGDEAGIIPAGGVGIADEKAAKIGVQYKLPTNTVLNAIAERMTRNAPNQSFNERQRNGFWLAATQALNGEDDLNVGWAHAARSPGTPAAEAADGSFIQGPADNAANMYTIGYKHHFADKRTTWYLVYARMVNHNAAHYDLGASGHGITTDCHDGAISASCFAGTTLQAVSLGMTYNF